MSTPALPFRFINEPKVTSEWRGDALWWQIEGEWISDHDLGNWCANNMGDSQSRHMDIARRVHMVAYASRNACKECGANGDYLRINWAKFGRCSACHLTDARTNHHS